MRTDDGGSRRTPDPLQMSATEKVMAEWEARHDVAARGRRGDPEAVQHYVARSRLTSPPPTPARAAGAPRRAPRGEPVRPEVPVPEQPAPRTRSLLSRLLHRSS